MKMGRVPSESLQHCGSGECFQRMGGEVVEVVMDVVGSGGRGGMTVDAVAAMVMVDAVVGGAAVVFLVELVG